MLSAFLTSSGLIFLAELGDKTNFLVFYLASRYRLKVVVLPIFLAVALLEAVAVFFGSFLRTFLPPWVSYLTSGLVFLIAFCWLWRESSKEEEEEVKNLNSASGFRLPLIIFSSFLLAELGDKTQFSTLALATHFDQALMVWLGGTWGMFFPNFVISLFGERVARWPYLKIFHKLGAFLFLFFALMSFYELLLLILG